MSIPLARRERRVPARALALSLAALVVPVIGAFWTPRVFEDHAALLWLLALVPAFLLAYYRGWTGVATALAAGMATLSLTQVVATWIGRPVPDLLLGVVVAYIAIALGIGWLAELLHRDVDAVEDLAFTDVFTGLPNRRHARIFLENEFAAAERGRLLSVALFDLDDFESYNERHGSEAGDRALRSVAELLAEHTRQMNLTARFGGEEFLSVLSGSGEEGAMIFADRIRSEVKRHPLPEGRLTVSVGIAAYHPHMRGPDELLAAADHALYRAKNDGRDCVRIFQQTLLETVSDSEDRPGESAGDGGESREYPRSAEEIGGSPPPVTLLPHRITGFGEGRRVLLVEDDEAVRHLVGSFLDREGFDVVESTDVPGAIRELRSEFEVVITDLGLPGPSGTELIRTIRSRWPATQIVVITGIKDSAVAAEALSAGADRYLYKPFGMSELRTQVVDSLTARDRRAGDRDGDRAARASEVPDESRSSVREGALSLARGAELRDPHLRGHAERVWAFARELARTVDPDEKELPRDSLELACRLHDVGRLRVPREIWQKEGPLTPEELDRVQEHPRIGRRILEPVLEDEFVLAVVSWHHERWDGGGYPDRLAGEAIPFGARLVSLADALEAMSSPRPHREALSWEAAAAQVREGAGTQFDPALADAFEVRLDALEALFRSGRGNG